MSMPSGDYSPGYKAQYILKTAHTAKIFQDYITDSAELAQKEADLALGSLDRFASTKYLDAMYNLAKFSVERRF